MARFLLLLVILKLASPDLFAQEVTNEHEESVENQAANEATEQKDDGNLQQLDWLRKHPVAINVTEGGELIRNHLISDLQAGYLIDYRKKAGLLIHRYELQSIPGWDIETIRKVLPYISFSSQATLSETLKKRFAGGERSVLFRFGRTIEKAKGYLPQPNGFSGDRNQYQVRYQYRYANLLSYGMVADKDAGEPFFRGASKAGFDFYSFHLFARRLGIVKMVAVGDFTVNLGQGLLQWQALAFGKSTDITGVKRQADVLQPYRSAGEFTFSRGAGFTLEKGRLEGTLFLSARNYNATIDDSTMRYSSIQTSGLSRTPSEVMARRKLKDLSVGGRLRFSGERYKISLNMSSHHFSLMKAVSFEPYNLLRREGRSLNNVSIDYTYTLRNFHFFGEEARDRNGATAFLNGVLSSLGATAEIALVNRRISRSYQSFQSNAFTESSTPSNENGTYVTINWRLAPGVQFTAYSDHYHFPWLKYRIDAPAYGTEQLIQLQYQPDKKSVLYLRFKTEDKPLNELGATLNTVVSKRRQTIRFHLETKVTTHLQLKGRAELCLYDRKGPDEQEGFLSYFEGHYKGGRWNATARLQYFETGGYNSRIYAYETDVLYSYSTPSFYETGYRYYINLNYKFSKKFACWVRSSGTFYTDGTHPGSGMEQLDVPHKSDIKVQVVYNF